MEELKTNDYLRGIVMNLPTSPGIYQYLNAEGTIIYVGKAKNLKRLFLERPPLGKDPHPRKQDCRHPLHRSEYGRRRALVRKQPYQEIQAPL